MRSFVLPIIHFQKYMILCNSWEISEFLLPKDFRPGNSRTVDVAQKDEYPWFHITKFIEVVVILSNIGRSSHRILGPT